MRFYWGSVGLIFLLSACSSFLKKPERDPAAIVFNESEVLPPRQTEVMVPEEVGARVSSGGRYTLTITNQNEIQGFHFTNTGKNEIVPKVAQIGEGPERQFEFDFPGRRAQDIELHVTDTPSARLSDLRENWMMFFPRKVVPAIERLSDGRYKVTIPTGEEFFVHGDSLMLESGVLKEAPMNLETYAQKRDLFPDVQYTGKGLWLRVRRRGENPHIGQIATVILNAEDGNVAKTCQIPASSLWQQNEGSGNHFLFAKDADFDAFLKAKCGFGIP